jgi:hypothetical protein
MLLCPELPQEGFLGAYCVRSDSTSTCHRPSPGHGPGEPSTRHHGDGYRHRSSCHAEAAQPTNERWIGTRVKSADHRDVCAGCLSRVSSTVAAVLRTQLITVKNWDNKCTTGDVMRQRQLDPPRGPVQALGTLMSPLFDLMVIWWSVKSCSIEE